MSETKRIAGLDDRRCDTCLRPHGGHAAGCLAHFPPRPPADLCGLPADRLEFLARFGPIELWRDRDMPSALFCWTKWPTILNEQGETLVPLLPIDVQRLEEILHRVGDYVGSTPPAVLSCAKQPWYGPELLASLVGPGPTRPA